MFSKLDFNRRLRELREIRMVTRWQAVAVAVETKTLELAELLDGRGVKVTIDSAPLATGMLVIGSDPAGEENGFTVSVEEDKVNVNWWRQGESVVREYDWDAPAHVIVDDAIRGAGMLGVAFDNIVSGFELVSTKNTSVMMVEGGEYLSVKVRVLSFVGGEDDSVSLIVTCQEDQTILKVEWLEDGVRHHSVFPAVREWWRSGSLRKEAWYVDGELHNPESDVPGLREWYSGGGLKREEWRVGGVLNNPSYVCPAVRTWHENGRAWTEEWWEDGVGQDSRMGVAAGRAWSEGGQLILERFLRDGVPSNPDSLTAGVREWHGNGVLKVEYWVIDGAGQNPAVGVPARREWWDNGVLGREVFYCGGVVDNPDGGGSAVRVYDFSGTLIREEWWLGGVKVGEGWGR